MSGGADRIRDQGRRGPALRLPALLLGAALLVLTACSALQPPSTDDVDPTTGDEPVETAAGTEGSPPAIPEWIREPFREAFAGHSSVDDLLDRGLNVLRLAHDPDGPPAYLAWLSLDRLNGLGLLFEPAVDDPDADGLAYVVTYRFERPITEVSYDQQTRFLILTVIEESGSDLWGHWFRVLRPVEGSFREVWRGPAYVSTAKGSDYVVQRQAGLITDPSRSEPSFLHSHVMQLLFQPPGAEPETLRRDERIDIYEWDPQEQRFFPAGPVPGAGRYLALESAFTVPLGAVNAFIADAARPYLSLGAVLRLVDGDGQVVAVETPVEAGTHMWLQIPTGLAPGTYRVELAPDPQQPALDTAELEVMDVER